MLSLTIWLTILGGIIVMLLPRRAATAIKLVALVTCGATLAIGLYAYVAYLRGALAPVAELGPGWALLERRAWVPSLGIQYLLAADGINLPMVILNGFICFTGVMISWNIDHRTKEFFALFLFLVAGVYGVFVSMDLFLLFLWYELAVFPMYLLIGIWGSIRKEYAAMKLTLYLLIGSALILVGLIAIWIVGGQVNGGARTFDMFALARLELPRAAQLWIFPLIFAGFGTLAGMWPLHTWSPVGHVAAPTSVSMLHAGVLMKLGAYGCLRVAMMLLPEGAAFWLPWVMLLALVNVVYGSLIAMVQRHFKYVIGYSSVSHMGFVVMGLATMNQMGMSGAVLQMFSHGIMTGLFFAIVGRMVYDRTHTLWLRELGGLSRPLPFAAIAFAIAGFASMGLPGLSGFIAELQILTGTWQARPVVAALSGIGIVVTAGYILRYIHGVFFGAMDERFAGLPPITGLEKTAGAILIAVLFLVGIVPGVMTDIIHDSIAPLAAELGALAAP